VAFGHRTKVNAEQAALTECQKLEKTCSVYAVGNEIVVTRTAPAQ
jgi:hypothetical protein